MPNFANIYNEISEHPEQFSFAIYPSVSKDTYNQQPKPLEGYDVVMSEMGHADRVMAANVPYAAAHFMIVALNYYVAKLSRGETEV